MQFLKGSRNIDDSSEINEDDTREEYALNRPKPSEKSMISQATTGAAVPHIKNETVRSHEGTQEDVGRKKKASLEKSSPRGHGNFYTCPLCAITYKWKLSLQLHAYKYHNIDVSEMFRGLPRTANSWTDKLVLSARVEDGKQEWSVMDEIGEKIMDVSGGQHDAKNRRIYYYGNKHAKFRKTRRRRVYGYDGTSESNEDSEDEKNPLDSPEPSIDPKNPLDSPEPSIDPKNPLDSPEPSIDPNITEMKIEPPDHLVQDVVSTNLKNHAKLYQCDTCGEQYAEKRELRCHVEAKHGVTMSTSLTLGKSTSSLVDGKKNSSTKEYEAKKDNNVYTCPLCPNTYTWKFNLQIHAQNHHDVDVSELFRGLPKRANDKSNKIAISATYRNGKYGWSITNEYGEKVMDVPGKKHGDVYRFKCPDCEKSFRIKGMMRRHAYVWHKIVVLQRKSRRGMTRKKTPASSSRAKTEIEEKAGNSKSSKGKDSAVKRNDVRKTNKITEPDGEQVESCPEAMRDEQMTLRESLAAETPRQTEKCFLCHNDFIELKRHLKDYHRVYSPETVLPLTRVKTRVIGGDTENFVKVENTDCPDEEDKPMKSKKSRWRNFFVVRRINKNGQKRRVHECLTCSFQYSTIGGVRRHLKRYIVNGVIEDHEAFVPGPKVVKLLLRHESNLRNRSKRPSINDPLAIEDPEDSARVDDAPDDGRKRTISSNPSSDETTTTTKKCKIDDNDLKEEIKDDDHFIREKIIETDDDDHTRDDKNDDDEDADFEDEDKTPSLRDTRDNSDQDSGISFTIKNSNNWYKVVDKVPGDDKGNVVEVAKSLDSSSFLSNSSPEITTMTASKTSTTSRIYCRRDEDLIDFSRKRDIRDPLDCQEPVAKTIGSIVNDNGDRVDIEDDKVVAENLKDNRSCRKDEHPVHSSNKVPGKISINLSTGNSVKRDETSDISSNVLHQCPVCRKRYPTERDVTVHMLEHKISRTNFRTARLRSIPISALRRYPSKKV